MTRLARHFSSDAPTSPLGCGPRLRWVPLEVGTGAALAPDHAEHLAHFDHFVAHLAVQLALLLFVRVEQLRVHELRDALQAVVAGKPIAVTRSKALGCDIDFDAPAK